MFADQTGVRTAQESLNMEKVVRFTAKETSEIRSIAVVIYAGDQFGLPIA